MKKTLPIIIILVVIVAALAGWFLIGKGKKATDQGDGQRTGQEEAKGESFSGKIKDAFTRNIPLKCTYKMDDNNFGTGWIKNKRYYGEITANNKQGFIILVDNCMWTWDKDKAEGVKMCFDVEEGESIWDEMESQDNQFKDDYNCSPSVVNDAVFTPPNNIKFTDLDEMMKGLGQPSQAAEEEATIEE